MNLKTLSLLNFRNFSVVEALEFPPNTILVAAAPNATGKTNFLESLVVLLRGKSFRGGLPECVRWGEQELVVRGVVERGEGEARLAVAFSAPQRRVKLEENGEIVSPIELYSHYPFVLFLPEDTFLFMRGPAVRRNFLNHVLISEPSYLSALVQYQRSLRQRNAALKRGGSWEELAPWTEALVREAERVWRQRQKLSDFFASHVERLYQEVTGEHLSLAVRFIPGVKDVANFREVLEAAWADERRYHYTLSGPHRDDVEIRSDGRLVQSVLSRGQMRGLTFALKVASWHFLRQVTGETPLLFLDEVLSELDEERAERLLTHLPQGQVLLTCTKVPAVLRDFPRVHLLDLREIIEKGRKKSEVRPQEAEKEYAPTPIRVASR